MNDPILSVSDLAICFGQGRTQNEVVSGVSLSLHAGKTLALVGESGSGKTITGRALMGLLPTKARITRGQINYSAKAGSTEDLVKASPRRMRALRGCEIGMIFQEPMSSLSPFHTIGAQVRESLLLHGEKDERTARERCIETFEKVGFPNPNRAYDAYPFELSGGMRQRAMIAMATICRPAILIADEPTTALDVTTQALILDLIQKRQEETGMAVLLITHDLGVVSNVADHITVLRKGRVMEAGIARDLLTDPRHPYLKRLIDAAPDVDVAAAHNPTPSSDLIIEARNVSKTFVSRGRGLFGIGSEKIHALCDVDLTLPRGETVALVGESGSGKSTLANVVLNAIKPDSGATLTYHCDETGKELNIPKLSGSELNRFRRDVQIVFQDPYASLSPRMTVQDILAEPLAIHNVCNASERRDRSAAMLKRVGLDPSHLGRFPHAFSGGQRQRISIARALMLEPKLLICDEPTSALDVSVQAQVLELLNELREQFNLSYLFISHDLAVVSRLADEIAVMCRGAIVEQAPARALFENPSHPYTKALMAAAPNPSPDHKLDLNAIALGAGARPEEWPAPFRYERTDPAPLREVDSRHFVRMTT
jgi:peptide/nickel transport system ATP-binding protein